MARIVGASSQIQPPPFPTRRRPSHTALPPPWKFAVGLAFDGCELLLFAAAQEGKARRR
jgi:hypothetical protein